MGAAPVGYRLRFMGWGLALALLPGLAAAQKTHDLYYSDAGTVISGIDFRFQGKHLFDAEVLRAQMASRAPGFSDRLRRLFRWLPLVSYDPGRFRLDPVELQKDIVRLRRFYARNGFLDPYIDYPSSTLDTTRNTLEVIIEVEEGPPLILQDLTFRGPDGRHAVYSFPQDLQPRWRDLRGQLLRERGERYTEARGLLIQSRVLGWLRDRGYAFAEVHLDPYVDREDFRVDLRIAVDPGPLTVYDRILVEGNTSVPDRIVTRELPFRPGDRYSNTRLIRGQREIFGLNLFRVALVDLPEQPRDSTVTVRFRIREARPRYLSTQGGYAREDGLNTEVDWRHRNFFGGARQFSISAAFQSGILARPPSERLTVRKFTAAVSLRQPYLFTTRLSGIVSPFISWLDDRNQLGTRFFEFGLNTSLVFELLPFRTLTVQHTFARANPLGGAPIADSLGVYNRNVFSAGATLGWLNNYQNPRRGYLVRPSVEAGGGLGSAVEYVKVGLAASGYLPLTRRIRMNGRLFVGRMQPLGASRDQRNAEVEFRFDPIRYYAGGSGDVRGWASQLLGDKYARIEKGKAIYEVVGGESKLTGSLEVTWPFPGLGSRWGLATFLDFGKVSGRLLRDTSGAVVFGENGLPRFREGDLFDLKDLQFGAGAGIRFQTPIGMLRFDVAYKVNPTPEDLIEPGEFLEKGAAGRRSFLNRINPHFSIGQSF